MEKFRDEETNFKEWKHAIRLARIFGTKKNIDTRLKRVVDKDDFISDQRINDQRIFTEDATRSISQEAYRRLLMTYSNQDNIAI